MKHLLLFSLLSLSANLMASEFDEAVEKKCYQEAKALGCVDSAGEQVNSCLTKKKTKLSAQCKSLIQTQSSN